MAMIVLSVKEFNQLRELIRTRLGIKMPDQKRLMVQSRLQKRLNHLGLDSFEDYLDHLNDPNKQKLEFQHLIDQVTTNKTDFFREPKHFEFLLARGLPELHQRFSLGRQNRIKLWSAACSSGEEPYTLAMSVQHYLVEKGWPFDFVILGTDVSSRVLEKARRAVYDEESIKPVPEMMKKSFLLKGRDPSLRQVRVVPELRRKVHFHHLNFMDNRYPIKDRFHVVFCRNALIYFDHSTQEAILSKLCQFLLPGGFLMIGHSESIHGMSLPVRPVAPTVYQKTN